MNPSNVPSQARLYCHPATPCAVPLSLSVELRCHGDGLRLRYTLLGDTTALRIPPPSAPLPRDGLWLHSCFEAFVGTDTEAGYREFNFSPSSEWAAYRFRAERERDLQAEGRESALPMPPPTLIDRTPHALTLSARLPTTALPRSPSVLHIGLCAVIEEADGRLSYWALHHPGERPDFHHRDARTLRLAAPLP